MDASGLRAVRGIASPAQPGDFTHIRRAPSARLSAYVEHLWYVAWQLPAGAATRVATVPHPCVHWTFEAGRSTLTGPHPRLWQRTLTPSGEVLGIKFRPEGFRALWGASMVRLRGQILNPTELPQLAFAHDLGSVLYAAQSGVPLDARFDVLEHRLAAALPAPTADQVQVAQLIEAARCNPDLHRADAWAQHSGVTLRQLQRWLADWVGLSPKWILGRYRLHDTLHRLQQHPTPRLSDLAAEAGYADAAHFSRSFRSVLGVSPQQYVRRWRGG